MYVCSKCTPFRNNFVIIPIVQLRAVSASRFLPAHPCQVPSVLRRTFALHDLMCFGRTCERNIRREKMARRVLSESERSRGAWTRGHGGNHGCRWSCRMVLRWRKRGSRVPAGQSFNTHDMYMFLHSPGAGSASLQMPKIPPARMCDSAADMASQFESNSGHAAAPRTRPARAHPRSCKGRPHDEQH